jgi:hypothetical protein
VVRYLVNWRGGVENINSVFRHLSYHNRALGKVIPAAFAATCPALPPLRLAALACAAAPPCTQGAATMHRLS